jgi:hypothetical protein
MEKDPLVFEKKKIPWVIFSPCGNSRRTCISSTDQGKLLLIQTNQNLQWGEINWNYVLWTYLNSSIIILAFNYPFLCVCMGICRNYILLGLP